MAMEGHFQSHPEGAPLYLFGLPDQEAGDGALSPRDPECSARCILQHSLSAPMAGLETVPREDRPPVAGRVLVVPHHGRARPPDVRARLLAPVARLRGRLYDWPLLHRFALVMGPAGFVAVIAGWVTTEVGRQPWVVYGLLRTADSVSPIDAPAVAGSLVAFVVVYFSVFAAGSWYILRLMAHAPVAGEPGPRTAMRRSAPPASRRPRRWTPTRSAPSAPTAEGSDHGWT